MLIDLSFEISRRLYKTDLKPGTLIQSLWLDAKEDYQISKSATDKYDRYPADVWIPKASAVDNSKHLTYLNQLLLNEKHATRMRE